MDIRQVGGNFIAKTVYGKHLPLKEAGFRWDPQNKEWYTDDIRKLATVITLAENVDISPEAKKAERLMKLQEGALSGTLNSTNVYGIRLVQKLVPYSSGSVSNSQQLPEGFLRPR